MQVLKLRLLGYPVARVSGVLTVVVNIDYKMERFPVNRQYLKWILLYASVNVADVPNDTNDNMSYNYIP